MSKLQATAIYTLLITMLFVSAVVAGTIAIPIFEESTLVQLFPATELFSETCRPVTKVPPKVTLTTKNISQKEYLLFDVACSRATRLTCYISAWTPTGTKYSNPASVVLTEGYAQPTAADMTTFAVLLDDLRTPDYELDRIQEFWIGPSDMKATDVVFVSNIRAVGVRGAPPVEPPPPPPVVEDKTVVGASITLYVKLIHADGTSATVPVEFVATDLEDLMGAVTP